MCIFANRAERRTFSRKVLYEDPKKGRCGPLCGVRSESAFLQVASCTLLSSRGEFGTICSVLYLVNQRIRCCKMIKGCLDHKTSKQISCTYIVSLVTWNIVGTSVLTDIQMYGTIKAIFTWQGVIMGDALGLQALQGAYRDASTSPTDVIRRLYPLLAQEEGMFITLASLESLLERCRYWHTADPDTSDTCSCGLQLSVSKSGIK